MALTVEVMLGVVLLVVLGAFMIGLAALSRLPAKRGVALLGAIMLVSGGLIGLGIVQIPGPEMPPTAQGLFDAQFLSSSDTDRTETGENIAADGHSISYTMNTDNMAGLGDVNLDVRVTNKNIGASTDTWLFSGEITFVDFTQVSGSGPAQYIVNKTNFNLQWGVTYSETSAGAPTFTQEGDRVVSRDFATGASDVLNVDFQMLPTAMDDLAAGRQARLSFTLGGVTMSCLLIRSA